MEEQHQMLRVEAEQIEGKRDVQQAKQQAQLNSAASPPPSASSSPSHEFSFTISLHPSSTAKIPDNKTKSPPPFAAIDLSPADEIFFHGHLLPLHLLSHLPVSPRSSTNSMDSFTLPIKESSQDNNNNNHNSNKITSTRSSSDEYYYNNNDNNNNSDEDDEHDHHHQESRHVLEGKGRGKSKSFSLFPKWRKGCHDQEKGDFPTQKRKSKFDLVKRYMRLVKPFLSLRSKRETADEFLRQQPYSYSGNLRLRSNKKELRGRREFSAPASMRTSPTNSGLLVASGTVTPTSDSTMEELQAAIQAAIAHCKKSIETEDKIKLP